MSEDSFMDPIEFSTDIAPNTIIFSTENGAKETLKFCPNGDIFIQGRLAETDKAVVEGLRLFLRGVNCLQADKSASIEGESI